jgi:hypothetical protein
MNSDEKTDNEVTKNLGQLGEERQGFQKTLETNSTKEQSKMSKKKALALKHPQLNKSGTKIQFS